MQMAVTSIFFTDITKRTVSKLMQKKEGIFFIILGNSEPTCKGPQVPLRNLDETIADFESFSILTLKSH